VEAQHVHHPDLCDAAAEEVRALVDACSHQQAPIAATLDGQLAGAAVALVLQVLGTCLQAQQDSKHTHGMAAELIRKSDHQAARCHATP
jgi:hypothetical protein